MMHPCEPVGQGPYSVTVKPWKGRWVALPPDLDAVTTRAEHAETAPEAVGVTREDVEAIWDAAVGMYRTRTHPALVLCLRRGGEVLLSRAIGHASGHGPDAAPGEAIRLATPDTPFCIFSASKAVTAVLLHELDARNALRLDDPVAEYIPEFGQHRKSWITLRHVLTHRAGIPVQPTSLDPLALVTDWDQVIRLLCELRPASAAGRRLAYHAITGGFILGEAVRRATGRPIADHLRALIADPLGVPITYGVPPERLPDVAINHFTGLPVPFPFSRLIARALGLSMEDAVAASNDPRFLTSVIPSGNVVTTADGLARLYQLLLEEGRAGDRQVLDRRAVRRVRVESAYFELDLTLGIPVRYGQGMMLGARRFSLFGPDTRKAFGHYGFINIIGWADPERDLAGALLTSGKPILGNHLYALWKLLSTISRRIPRV